MYGHLIRSDLWLPPMHRMKWVSCKCPNPALPPNLGEPWRWRTWDGFVWPEQLPRRRSPIAVQVDLTFMCGSRCGIVLSLPVHISVMHD